MKLRPIDSLFMILELENWEREMDNYLIIYGLEEGLCNLL